MREKFIDYLRLCRLHKPVGIWLLLWPTLWGLWFAAGGVPPFKILWIFVLGVVLMRSAGCVINDVFDKDFDPPRRPHQRPPDCGGQGDARRGRAGVRGPRPHRLRACHQTQYADGAVGHPGRAAGSQLPADEALYCVAAGLPRARVLLGHTDGLRGGAGGGGLAGGAAADGREHLLGDCLRHLLRHGRQGRRRAHRRQERGDFLWPPRPAGDSAFAGAEPAAAGRRRGGIWPGPGGWGWPWRRPLVWGCC